MVSQSHDAIIYKSILPYTDQRDDGGDSDKQEDHNHNHEVGLSHAHVE